MTIMYHGTDSKENFSKFEMRPGRVGTVFGTENVSRHGIFFTPEKHIAKKYAGSGGKIIHVKLDMKKPFDMRNGVSEKMESDFVKHGGTTSHLYNHEQPWEKFDGESGEHFTNVIKKAGYDSVIINDESPDDGSKHESHIIFHPKQATIIKHEINESMSFKEYVIESRAKKVT